MNQRSRYGLTLALAMASLVAGAVLVSLFVLRRGGALPVPGSETYRDMVSAFHAGLAALDADANERAEASLARATALVPGEPAAWANLGLLKLRKRDYQGAKEDLEIARGLAPENGAIERLLGLLEGQRGQFAQAIAHLRRAVELDPKDVKARFSLVGEVERLGEPDSEAEALRLLGELAALLPDNAEVLRERARLATKRGDATALEESVAGLGRLAPSWPANAQEVYRTLQQALNVTPRTPAALALIQRQLAFLRNLLVQTPAFRQGLAAVQAPAGTVGEPIETFLRLVPPAPTPSPPDEGLAFSIDPSPAAGPGAAAPGEEGWYSLLATPLTAEGPPALFAVNGREVRRIDGDPILLPFPGGNRVMPPSPYGVLALDWNSDYRIDFVLAGASGLKVFQQKEDGSFADVTAATKLGQDVLGLDAFGVWTADVEMDGDLDLVLGARAGKTSVLRNNGDGTFTAMPLFENVTELRDFAWADLDGDGDPDAALLDARGGPWTYSNERAGKFQVRPAPEGLGKLAAIAVADVNRDGALDLLAWRTDGAVLRASDQNEGHGWQTVEIARVPVPLGNLEAPPTLQIYFDVSISRSLGPLGNSSRLFVADLDNNGVPDLIGRGSAETWIALADEKGAFQTRTVLTVPNVLAVADLNGDGRLDLAGLTGLGRFVRGLGRGTKDYHWQVIRPRGAKTFGDGRINSFGLGGEIEVRAGLLVQKQVIAGPIVHFGLGERPRVDVARIVWPNGTVQAEFDAKADQPLVAEQRLKGSCPFLYAFDGTAVRFVTDFLWRSPLGLRINAQDTAGVAQTEDWVKVRGDQLAPREGSYDVRITAELWETHYWDHVALLVVDHPRDTEVFVDERFAVRPPPLAVQVFGPLHPVARARDDQGRDVTETVSTRDGRYLDTFGRGAYQGVARDHWVEAELGEDAPRRGPLRLIAHGWAHPTDSSINVAIGQGRQAKPQGLVLEVPGPDGGWTVARSDLGFPAGKNKTILVDLDGVFPPLGPRRFRLRTNLEIYWDSLAVAVAIDIDAPAAEAALRIRRLAPESAELRARGYSLMTQANPGSPELPRYDTMTGTTQRWRDLVGFYTRFGDVRELLRDVDDRYVIANAGDELALRFEAPGPPPAGWARDFVMIGDGWNKDGDYNTAFSQTVLPLPSHRRPAYDRPPGALEDDPVYRFHPDDWKRHHTRYITPSDFQNGPRPRTEPQPRPRRKSEPKP